MLKKAILATATFAALGASASAFATDVSAFNRTGVTRCFRFYWTDSSEGTSQSRQFTTSNGVAMRLGQISEGTRVTHSIFGSTCGGSAVKTGANTILPSNFQSLEIRL